MTAAQHVAIVGAGMAGIACARTLAQAGHRVTVFEQEAQAGGRMASVDSPFGSFDLGTQYFTVRDERFALALQSATDICRPWSANAVRVLDAEGRMLLAEAGHHEAHWVAKPAMDALPRRWLAPLLAQSAAVHMGSRVLGVTPDGLKPGAWQIATAGPDDSRHVFGGFDTVVLATPAAAAAELLRTAGATELQAQVAHARMAPCWVLMLAFPNAAQAQMSSLGPQWNAARSTHHRIAWLARESSKPQRRNIERWTVQASATWSQEHYGDDAERVRAKLLKGFAEITGIRAEPAYAEVRRWGQALTTRPLGVSYLWDSRSGLAVCGDYLLGCRVEDAFVSGLELALHMA